MSEIETTFRDEPGGIAALVVYGLYLLSIPSAALLALVGVIVAYSARGAAAPIARSHFDSQIRLFWIAFAWAVGLFVLTLVGWALTLILIGLPLLWLAGAAGFVVMVWFTVMSLIGLVKLVNGQPA